MTDITPPAELLQLWWEQHNYHQKGLNELLIEAAQYGADREAERRPKPPSLKEQALKILHDVPNIDCAHYNILLRALEQLDD